MIDETSEVVARDEITKLDALTLGDVVR